jgi:hypothetical protein
MEQASSKALYAARFLLAICLIKSLTMKMEAVCSSETWKKFYWTTYPYIPLDITFNSNVFIVCDINVV